MTDYRFGRFQLHGAAQQLLVDGEPVSLGSRAFDLLMVLVERPGQLVSKAELLDRVWPGLVVEENNLQVQISALRKVLGADAIATTPGRGYRFTLRLEPVPASPAPPAAGDTAGAAHPGVPSIAVLPFVNMSDDGANEYFADGLSEELLNVLSKIRGLRVASRTSAFSFKGARVDTPTVARRLNVATVLEGSVRRSGPRVRIAAQLVDAVNDSHLWSDTYDRELQDIFAVQDDIARRVVTEIRGTLLGGGAAAPPPDKVGAEVSAAVRGRSHDPEAYRLFLQASFFVNRDNGPDNARAIDFLEEAVQRDPGYVQAWALLSFCHMHRGNNAWAPLIEEAERARKAAHRALAEGPDVAGGYWALGAVQMYYDWDWRSAEASLRHALQLAAEGSQLLLAARLLQGLGQLDEAAALIRQALMLDPLNVQAHVTSGLQFIYTGHPDDAETAYRKALDLGPDHRVRVHYYLGRAQMMQGRPSDALHEFGQEKHEAFRLLGFTLAHHARGRPTESNEAMSALIRKYADGSAYQIAEACAYRGDADAAFDWLERAFSQRDAGLASIKIDPLLSGLQTDPRWRQWLERMRLAD